MGKKKLFIDESYFDTIDSEEKAYFLGFLFADGCNTGKGVSIQLQAGDISILEKLKAALHSEHKVGAVRRTDGREHAYFSFCSRRLSNRLSELGCVPRKSFVLQFPELLPVPQYRHFLRGFMDGNGYIADIEKQNGKYAKHRLSIASTQVFCERVASIIQERCKVHCGVERGTSVYQMCVSGRIQVRNVLRYLYENAAIALERKWLLANRIITERFVGYRYSKDKAA
jgi:hypothetical protein